MIAQIAGQSGVPPSVIAETWTAEELNDQVTLARLEGRGQDKYRNAELLAAIHNGFAMLTWMQAGDPDRPPPKYLSPTDFLRKWVKPKAEANEEQVRKQLDRQSSFLDRLAGFSS